MAATSRVSSDNSHCCSTTSAEPFSSRVHRTSCNAGLFSGVALSYCTTCGASSWRAAGSASCVEYVAGIRSNVTSALVSTVCLAYFSGTWPAATAGAIACNKCNAVSFSSVVCVVGAWSPQAPSLDMLHCCGYVLISARQ